MQPARGYYLGKEVKKDSGIVTSSNVEDTHQKYEIVAVGGPVYADADFLIDPDYKVGDIVFTQKHAEGDTPQEVKDQKLALFQFSRVIGVIK